MPLSGHPYNYVALKFISVFGCLVILVLNETVDSELESIKYSVKKVNATMSELKINVHKLYLYKTHVTLIYIFLIVCHRINQANLLLTCQRSSDGFCILWQ